MNILITGVTRGLGRALTEEFIAAGHTIAGCGRTGEAILDLRFAHPSPHTFDVLDITNPVKTDIWSEKVTALFGAPPDLIINNAAAMNTPAPLWQITPDDFNRTIDTNIKGTFNILRAFLPAMVAIKQGIIVNISSGWGRSTDANVAPYCAAKYAIEGLTQSLAQELPSTMAAIALNPGIINTDLLQKSFGTSANNYPTPAEWAKTAAPFILSLTATDNATAPTIHQS